MHLMMYFTTALIALASLVLAAPALPGVVTVTVRGDAAVPYCGVTTVFVTEIDSVKSRYLMTITKTSYLKSTTTDTVTKTVSRSGDSSSGIPLGVSLSAASPSDASKGISITGTRTSTIQRTIWATVTLDDGQVTSAPVAISTDTSLILDITTARVAMVSTDITLDDGQIVPTVVPSTEFVITDTPKPTKVAGASVQNIAIDENGSTITPYIITKNGETLLVEGTETFDIIWNSTPETRYIVPLPASALPNATMTSDISIEQTSLASASASSGSSAFIDTTVFQNSSATATEDEKTTTLSSTSESFIFVTQFPTLSTDMSEPTVLPTLAPSSSINTSTQYTFATDSMGWNSSVGLSTSQNAGLTTEIALTTGSLLPTNMSFVYSSSSTVAASGEESSSAIDTAFSTLSFGNASFMTTSSGIEPIGVSSTFPTLVFTISGTSTGQMPSLSTTFILPSTTSWSNGITTAQTRLIEATPLPTEEVPSMTSFALESSSTDSSSSIASTLAESIPTASSALASSVTSTSAGSSPSSQITISSMKIYPGVAYTKPTDTEDSRTFTVETFPVEESFPPANASVITGEFQTATFDGISTGDSGPTGTIETADITASLLTGEAFPPATASVITGEFQTTTVGIELSTGGIDPTAVPIQCRETGKFNLTLDEIPPLVGGDSVPALPFFGTYKYFSFGGRFSVAPPPTAPFVPESAPLLLQFNATESRGDGVIPTGEIGPSKEYLDSGCFGFGARGVSLGCDSTDAPCDWQITGVRRSATGIDEEVVTQRASTSPCPTGNGCDLTELILLDRFRDLVKLRINVTVDGEAADWYADNFVLEWADKSCTAAICRSVQVILDDSCETGLCRSNEGEGGPSVR